MKKLSVEPSFLTHLFPINPFSTTWKHQKTVKIFWYFQGVEKGCTGNKWSMNGSKFISAFKYIMILMHYNNINIRKEAPMHYCWGKPLLPKFMVIHFQKSSSNFRRITQSAWLATKMATQEVFQCCLPLLQKYTCNIEICSFSDLIFERSNSPTASNSYQKEEGNINSQVLKTYFY